MFVVKIHYQASLAEVDKYVQAHRDFLDLYYEQGVFLASGPMIPRTGGIILAMGNDKEKLEAILAEDPYQQAGLVTYEIIAFSPLKYRKEIKELIA